MSDKPKSTNIKDFLSPAQVKTAVEIWEAELFPAKRICDEVIKPNLAEINAKLGQENDPMYLAYVCEYIFGQTLLRSFDINVKSR